MRARGERLPYRPELDAIRGVAIALVVASHVRIPGMIGAGWGGVVVFFVLSGYLITGLLLEEHDRSGTIRLGAFYFRRAGRLVPELVVMVATVTTVAMLVGAPDAIGNALVALTYTGDFANMAGDRIGQLSHTWTLAVEEQFYLLWPLGLLGVLRVASWRTLATVAILAALWRAGMVADGWNWNRYAFGPDAQLDALAAGCALALTRRRWAPGRWLVVLAFGLILAGSLSQAAFGVGAQATLGVPLVTLGSVLLIARGRIAWRPLVLLGRLSYSVYLWHIPILAGVWTVLGHNPPATILALLAVGIVAPVSYRLALPVREWAKRRSANGLVAEVEQLGRRDADVAGHVRRAPAGARPD